MSGLKKIQQVIQKEDLGAVIFWRPDELVMSLGYLPYYGCSFAVFTERETLLYIPEYEPQPFLREPVTLKTFPMGMMKENPWDLLFDRIQADLDDRGLRAKKIGCIAFAGGSALSMIAAEQPSLPADLLSRISSLAAGIARESEPALLELYETKLPEDLLGLRLAHQAAAEGVRAFFQALQQGKREIEVQCAVEHAIACQTGKNGIYFARGWAQIQSGRRSEQAGKYNSTSGKKLEKGELVLMELGVCVNGYWADLTRTGYVGEMPAQVKARYDLVAKAQQEAIRHIRAGVKASEVYQAAADVFRQDGCLELFNHGLGHGVGFRYHEFTPSLTPYCDMPLKAGMVVTVEPGLYEEGFGGIRIEDNVLVTEEGCERLSCQ